MKIFVRIFWIAKLTISLKIRSKKNFFKSFVLINFYLIQTWVSLRKRILHNILKSHELTDPLWTIYGKKKAAKAKLAKHTTAPRSQTQISTL